MRLSCSLKVNFNSISPACHFGILVIIPSIHIYRFSWDDNDDNDVAPAEDGDGGGGGGASSGGTAWSAGIFGPGNILLLSCTRRGAKRWNQYNKKLCVISINRPTLVTKFLISKFYLPFQSVPSTDPSSKHRLNDIHFNLLHPLSKCVYVKLCSLPATTDKPMCHEGVTRF